jgi:pyrroloquinoline quinone biosynthesis protein D
LGPIGSEEPVMTEESRPTLFPEAYPSLLSKARMQVDRITGERTLLYPEGVLILNATSAEIVDLCDGKHTVQDVVSILAERYGAPHDQIEGDILEYLQRLNSKCLLGLNGEASE